MEITLGTWILVLMVFVMLGIAVILFEIQDLKARIRLLYTVMETEFQFLNGKLTTKEK